jgi:hypothetical protein
MCLCFKDYHFLMPDEVHIHKIKMCFSVTICRSFMTLSAHALTQTLEVVLNTFSIDRCFVTD